MDVSFGVIFKLPVFTFDQDVDKFLLFAIIIIHISFISLNLQLCKTFSKHLGSFIKLKQSSVLHNFDVFKHPNFVYLSERKWPTQVLANTLMI